MPRPRARSINIKVFRLWEEQDRIRQEKFQMVRQGRKQVINTKRASG